MKQHKHLSQRGMDRVPPMFLTKKLARCIKLGSSALAMGALGLAPAWAQTDAPALEEILVSGQRQSMQSAQLIKQNADQIVYAIVADDIGNLPDRSVTGALQRVPGVTIERIMDIGDPEHVSAEGSGVAAHGMKHVGSELNGRDTFAASG